MKKLKDVFITESRFHGQVYTAPDGRQFDVPKLTYWAQEFLDITDVRPKDLLMSKSDEKHGSKEFKQHADEIKISPIVVVELEDGRLQIADGNHRAWKAMEAQMKRMPAYVIPWEDLPDCALVNKGNENGEN
jgi:ParB-like chromosome segregation protein Spo0J